MRTKDITLSASLMAIYLAINIAGAASPVKASSLMQSALFGFFWPYFSTRLNLTLIGLRVGFNMVLQVRSAPKFLNILKTQSVIGLGVFNWVTVEFEGIIEQRAIDLMVALAQLEIGTTFWIYLFGYLVFAFSITPYLFYKYFKYIGLFKRLPSF